MDSRKRMIEIIKEVYHLDAPDVFAAMLKVPREEFIPANHKDEAYIDGAVSIGYGQTISQPYTVAFMTSLLNLSKGDRVLEIGTGSGYQAAILSLLAQKVFTIERIPELAKSAKERLKRLGYRNIEVRNRNGKNGWKEEAPFDAVLITAGLNKVPQELFDQLKDEGVLIAPVGEIMTRYIKKGEEVDKESFNAFRFVPFVETG